LENGTGKHDPADRDITDRDRRGGAYREWNSPVQPLPAEESRGDARGEVPRRRGTERLPRIPFSRRTYPGFGTRAASRGPDGCASPDFDRRVLRRGGHHGIALEAVENSTSEAQRAGHTDTSTCA